MQLTEHVVEHVVKGLRSRELIAGAVAHGPWPTDNESCHSKAVTTSKTAGGCGGRQGRAVQSRYSEFLIPELVRDCSRRSSAKAVQACLRRKDCISAALNALKGSKFCQAFVWTQVLQRSYRSVYILYSCIYTT